MALFQLAQVNIAHAIDDLDSVTLQGFVDRLDEINTLADNSAGFIWRAIPDTDDFNYIPGYDDPRVIVNLSVWDDIESLKAFTYRSIHLELIQQKTDWFKKTEGAHLALWWVPAGTQPTEKDAVERLNLLTKNGPSEDAFTFSRPFSMPS